MISMSRSQISMSTAKRSFLLDTHTFLWMTMAPNRIGASARRCLEEPASTVFLSLASIWEIAIKSSLGKLDLPGSVASYLDEQLALTRTKVLHIAVQHAIRVSDLPWHHRDPFDRLLVAQALHEKLPLLSKDERLGDYGVERIW